MWSIITISISFSKPFEIINEEDEDLENSQDVEKSEDTLVMENVNFQLQQLCGRIKDRVKGVNTASEDAFTTDYKVSYLSIFVET